MDRPRGPSATTTAAPAPAPAAAAAAARGGGGGRLLSCRQFSFLYYLVAVLALVQLSGAFQYVPGSSCQSICANGSLDADAVCLDAEFNSTAGGRRVRSCVGCLLNSTAVDTATNETDVEFGLLALRFTLSSCMFGIPDERVSLSSPCQVTCTPLNTSISYDLDRTPSDNSARLDYCTVAQFDDITINNCAFCYSLIPQQLYVANFLQALHIACRDPPEPGNPFFPEAAAIFNETLIAGPAPPADPPTQRGLHGTALALAIALPVVGGIIIISSLCFCCFISARRRRRRMAASGRISRVVEHEVRMHSPVLLTGDSKKQMMFWGSPGHDEPACEMSDLTSSTPASAAAAAATPWSAHFGHHHHPDDGHAHDQYYQHYQQQQQQQQQHQGEPGIALGGHENDGTPMRNSFYQNQPIGDPNLLHEQYFGIEEDHTDYSHHHAVAVAGAGAGAGATAYSPTTGFHHIADPGARPYSGATSIPATNTPTTTTAAAAAVAAVDPSSHAMNLYHQIRAEHAANPNLQYHAQTEEQIQQQQQQQQQEQQQYYHHYQFTDRQRGPWT